MKKRTSEHSSGPSGNRAGMNSGAGEAGPGKTGKKSPESPTRPPRKTDRPGTGLQETHPSSRIPEPGPSLATLSKLTRPVLAERAAALGIPVLPSDTKSEIVSRILNHTASASPRPLSGKREKTGDGAEKTKDRKSRAPHKASGPVTGQARESDPSLPAAPMTAGEAGAKSPAPPAMDSRDETAPGWKYFMDISYEPVRRESGHSLTLFPLSPFRVEAFFAVDLSGDSQLAQRIQESGLILKIRDITGAVSNHPEAGRIVKSRDRGELHADHIFDITVGPSSRWSIPLWSSHRYLEAWLGFYHERAFRVLARSRIIRTPRGGPSSRLGTLFHLRENAWSTPAGKGGSLPLSEARWTELPHSGGFPGKSPLPE